MKLTKEELLNIISEEITEVMSGKQYPCDMIGPKEYNKIYDLLSDKRIEAVVQAFELLVSVCGADVEIERTKEYRMKADAPNIPFAGVEIIPASFDAAGEPNFVDADGMIEIKVFGRNKKISKNHSTLSNWSPDLIEEISKQFKLIDNSKNQKFSKDFFLDKHFASRQDPKVLKISIVYSGYFNFLLDFFNAYYDRSL